MQLLAVETSAAACSAALFIDGVVLQHLEIAPRRHGELILPMMQELLAHAALQLSDLDALALSCGPGSFTGVRIATAVVQGAAFAADLPVVAISTLRALAQGQFRRGGQRQLLTALDARMNEVYCGSFIIDNNNLAAPIGTEQVCTPPLIFCPPAGSWFGVGSGWGAHGAALAAAVGAQLDGTDPQGVCEAYDVATLAAAEYRAGRHGAPASIAPVYLRNQVTRISDKPC
jgi:tRNA threonylcarbamoyladenosine biosynthesis protein TsaB